MVTEYHKVYAMSYVSQVSVRIAACREHIRRSYLLPQHQGYAKVSLLTAGMTTDRSKDCSRHVQRLGLRHARLRVLHTHTHARTHTRKTCYDLNKRHKRFKIKQGVLADV